MGAWRQPSREQKARRIQGKASPAPVPSRNSRDDIAKSEAAACSRFDGGPGE